LIRLCESYNRDYGDLCGISYRAMLTATPFGPGCHGKNAAQQVIGTLIARLHEAKEDDLPEVYLPYPSDGRQEFLYADDIAAAALYVMNVDTHLYASVTAPSRGFLNAGYGPDVSFCALAYTLAGIVGYGGKLSFASQPKQSIRSHRLDSHRLQSIGWRPQLDIEDALTLTYFDYVANRKVVRA